MLEAKISEIARTSLKDLGVETTVTDAGSDFTFNLLSGLPLTSAFGTSSFIDDKVTLKLSALEKQGLAKTLAEPNLVALSGQEASFLVGGEFPVPVLQSGTVAGAVTVTFKEFGVGLKFTPTVLSKNRINLRLNAEVSAIDAAVSSTVQGITVPGVATRRAATTIEMADGQSFAIAGLLQNDINNIVNKFPGLGDVPVLGALFRSTDFQRNETELVIVVTPRLVKPVPPGRLLLPTDGYIPPSDADQYLLGDVEGRSGEAQERLGPQGSGGQARPATGGIDGAYGHQL
jgi:pilus assembly protein CpaC